MTFKEREDKRNQLLWDYYYYYFFFYPVYIPFGWRGDKNFKEMFKTIKWTPPLEEMGIALCIWYTIQLCGHHCLSFSICSVSLFPHTVWLCEVEGKELTVSCQQWRHQTRLFGRSLGAWAHRTAAGITPGEMLLLQGWFRTIMEKLCGGFGANHPDACTHIKLLPFSYGPHWGTFIRTA